VDRKAFDFRQELSRPGIHLLHGDREPFSRVSNLACPVDDSLHYGRGVAEAADLTIEEVAWRQLRALGGGKEFVHNLRLRHPGNALRKMLGKERDGQYGTLAGAEIEQELVLRSEEEGADHDRMKVLVDFGVRSLESKRFGLMVIEPHPALFGGIVFQTAELLECAQQTIVVEDLVMQPDRLKVFARHRRQDGFVSHVPFLLRLHSDRDPESFPGGPGEVGRATAPKPTLGRPFYQPA